MKKVLLIGNGINNINEKDSHSWENILSKIANLSNEKIIITNKKPFPLLYEEIYLKTLNAIGLKESELKKRIATLIKGIEPNIIHEELIKLDCENYITTNYDYSLEQVILRSKTIESIQNHGIIQELKYSIFRHNVTENKKFWHIHGEINYPNSITLGYEHYGGQLQQIRNYVVSGTNYKNDEISKTTLHKQLKKSPSTRYYSWIDYLFTHDVHIIGLSLDYIETDLWYLLTNRARFQMENSGLIKNKIFYYSPEIYKNEFKEQLMQANNIETIYLKGEKLEYYQNVINKLKSN